MTAGTGPASRKPSPDYCFVCGGERHADNTENGGHKFWSELDAWNEFTELDKRTVTSYNKEAAYVAEYRPY